MEKPARLTYSQHKTKNLPTGDSKTGKETFSELHISNLIFRNNLHMILLKQFHCPLVICYPQDNTGRAFILGNKRIHVIYADACVEKQFHREGQTSRLVTDPNNNHIRQGNCAVMRLQNLPAPVRVVQNQPKDAKIRRI